MLNKCKVRLELGEDNTNILYKMCSEGRARVEKNRSDDAVKGFCDLLNTIAERVRVSLLNESALEEAEKKIIKGGSKSKKKKVKRGKKVGSSKKEQEERNEEVKEEVKKKKAEEPVVDDGQPPIGKLSNTEEYVNGKLEDATMFCTSEECQRMKKSKMPTDESS